MIICIFKSFFKEKTVMKKSVKVIICVVLCILIVGGAVGGWVGWNLTYHQSKWSVEGDDAVAEMDFEQELLSLDMMDNTWQTAVSQTEIYNIVKDHFASPLPEGKTAKKAIVIGYDGCRVDTFRLLANSKRSAINTLLADGGQAVFCYAGGVNYPEENIQATSTAPGWCSMLTGVLSDVHKITNNNMTKEIEPKTLVLSLPEDGTVKKSSFYVSWSGHFVEKDSTYIGEKRYAKENKINAHYVYGFFDSVTRSNVLRDLKNTKNGSDFIFLTLEYTDHEGHSTGFTPTNPRYVSAFRNAEATGCDFIEAIKNRATYDTEDWLILITTDHGGIGGGHGGPSFEERITFIVSNKQFYS